jgi:glyoxylase-like metal-dependent hydrolase (beta-lactamase superfamily II)
MLTHRRVFSILPTHAGIVDTVEACLETWKQKTGLGWRRAIVRIRGPGRIQDKLWLLGRLESCVYLIEGRTGSMIISGGMSYLVPDLIRQFDAFGLDEKRIKKHLILHAHFDHIGIVPFFKRRHPDLEVFASKRAWEILQKPKSIRTINSFSRSVAEKMGKTEVYVEYDLDWNDDVQGTPLCEGDRIDLGDLEVFILETPGHSSCSISAYIPQLRALFASDSAGIPYKEMIITAGNSNYTRYQESLEKLKDLNVDCVCADHYGCVVGNEAGDFIRQSIEAAGNYRTLIEEVYRRKGGVDAAAREMINEFYSANQDYFISQEILEGVYRQIVRHVADDMNKNKNR